MLAQFSLIIHYSTVPTPRFPQGRFFDSPPLFFSLSISLPFFPLSQKLPSFLFFPPTSTFNTRHQRRLTHKTLFALYGTRNSACYLTTGFNLRRSLPCPVSYFEQRNPTRLVNLSESCLYSLCSSLTPLTYTLLCYGRTDKNIDSSPSNFEFCFPLPTIPSS